MNRFWIIGLATLCVGASLPPAHASPEFEPGSSIKVRYGDLDLFTEPGVTELYQRINRAARKVCNSDIGSSIPERMRAWRFCVDTAVANAVRDVNNQNLTAMFRQKARQAPAG